MLDTVQCKSATDVSLFCFNRPDLGNIVAMFGCPWGEALRKWKEEDLVEAVQAEGADGTVAFAAAVQEFWKANGFPAHPMYDSCRGQVPWGALA